MDHRAEVALDQLLIETGAVPPHPAPPDVTRELRVLVVSAEAGELALLREACLALQAVRIELVEADDLASALGALDGPPVDACLVDFHLGNSNALDLLRALPSAAQCPPVIVTSDHYDRELDLAAMRAGAEDYLEKGDLSPRVLERALRHAIERAATVRALQNSEERHALALRGSNDGIWDWDLRNNRLYLSARWKSMLGWSEDEVGDAPREWFQRVHLDDLQPLQEELQAHLEGRTPQFEFEQRVLHRDGGYRWVYTRGVALRDARGVAFRIAGSQTDVTDKKEGEEALLSHVSHELRTPLSAIYMFLTILGDGLAGDLSPRQQDFVGRALRNVDQLKAMINGLMESLRIRNGKLAVEPTCFELAPLVEDALSTVAASIEDRRLEFSTELDEGLPCAFADPDRVRQVLINLLDNAVKFTPNGGRVTVSAHMDESNDRMFRLSVRDTGRGIDPGALNRIFERLHQERGTHTSRQGLGLGLHICREIVERHRGRIWVESEPGAGATFHFTLPRFSLPAILEDGLGEGAATGPACLLSLRPRDGHGAARGAFLQDAHAVLRQGARAGRECVLPALPGTDRRALHIVARASGEEADARGARFLRELQEAPELRGSGLEFELSILPLATGGDGGGGGFEELARRAGLAIRAGDHGDGGEGDGEEDPGHRG